RRGYRPVRQRQEFWRRIMSDEPPVCPFVEGYSTNGGPRLQYPAEGWVRHQGDPCLVGCPAGMGSADQLLVEITLSPIWKGSICYLRSPDGLELRGRAEETRGTLPDLRRDSGGQEPHHAAAAAEARMAGEILGKAVRDQPGLRDECGLRRQRLAECRLDQRIVGAAQNRRLRHR